MGLLENAHNAYLKWKESNEREQHHSREQEQQPKSSVYTTRTKESNPYLILH